MTPLTLHGRTPATCNATIPPDTMATNEERLKFHFIDDTEYIMGKLFN